MTATHGKRILAFSLTADQMRAIRAAVRLAQEDASLYRDRSLPTLARALEAIEAAWKDGQPDYGRCTGASESHALRRGALAKS